MLTPAGQHSIGIRMRVFLFVALTAAAAVNLYVLFCFNSAASLSRITVYSSVMYEIVYGGMWSVPEFKYS